MIIDRNGSYTYFFFLSLSHCSLSTLSLEIIFLTYSGSIYTCRTVNLSKPGPIFAHCANFQWVKGKYARMIGKVKKTGSGVKIVGANATTQRRRARRHSNKTGTRPARRRRCKVGAYFTPPPPLNGLNNEKDRPDC